MGIFRLETGDSLSERRVVLNLANGCHDFIMPTIRSTLVVVDLMFKRLNPRLQLAKLRREEILNDFACVFNDARGLASQGKFISLLLQMSAQLTREAC